MKKTLLRCISLTFFCGMLYGCPVDRVHNDLHFNNASDRKIKTLVNLEYPDSSLARAAPDGYFEPHDDGYIGASYNLEDADGITVFVFEYEYFHQNWGTKEELSEDSLLARYCLSRDMLDSIRWRISYPPSPE